MTGQVPTVDDDKTKMERKKRNKKDGKKNRSNRNKGGADTIGGDSSSSPFLSQDVRINVVLLLMFVDEERRRSRSLIKSRWFDVSFLLLFSSRRALSTRIDEYCHAMCHGPLGLRRQ